uniref:Uncharacterized protein n=1 Tax=viral metagenome TaxID=1070528 RepID=A0A6C0DQ02_9ZZZZ
MKRRIRITKKRRQNSKKKMGNTKKIIVGGGELEEFREKYINLMAIIQSKIQEQPDYSATKPENLCHDLYNDECVEIQHLFSENRQFLREDFVLNNIYGIGDEASKNSLLFIYYDLLEEIRLEELYNSSTETTSTPSKPIEPPTIEELGKIMPIIGMKEYWKGIINKIEKKKHDEKQKKYRQQSRVPFIETLLYTQLDDYKNQLKQIVTETPDEICVLLKETIKHYDVASDKYIEYNQKLCLTLLIIGYLTNLLFTSDTCSLILKGGKAVQFFANVPSDDIDITIAPKGNQNISDEQIEYIGHQIANFIIWVLSDVYSVESNPRSTQGNGLKISKLVRGEGGSKIIKLSIQTDFGYLPILDIGLGYNSFPEKIKGFNNVKMIDETPYSMKSEITKKLPNYGYCHADIGSIITEKLYYILEYLSSCDHANSYYRNKSYYNLIKYMDELTKQYGASSIEKIFIQSVKSVVKYRINERDRIMDILTAITWGMFINRWFVIEKSGISRGLYPDVHVMCMRDDTMIQLNGWGGNKYTTVYDQYKLSSAPSLTVPNK